MTQEMGKGISKEDLKKAICYFVFYIALAAIFPFVLAPFASNEHATIPEWIQRGGSVTVALAIFLEAKSSNFYRMLNPVGFDSLPIKDLREKYGTWYKFMNASVIFLMIYGTVIWGYGDIIFAAAAS